MDSKKAEALLKKYWEGKLGPDEESELKNHFLHGSNEGDPDHAYFNYLIEKRAQNRFDNNFDEEILKQIGEDDKSRKLNLIPIKYWYIAASLAFLISISIIFKNEYTKVDKVEQVVKVDTYEDPAKAFEETKRALLMISSKLNQSGEYATKFSKFEESQKNLKQN
jgi:hypothetical protein